MKRLLLGFAVGLVAAIPLYAQVVETYSFGVTQNQVNRVDIGRVTYNEQKCAEADLAFTCTEAQLQAVPGFESDEIYADSEAGREELILDTVLVPWFRDILDNQKSWDTEKAQTNWQSLDRTTKDSICSSLGLSAGCEIY